MKTNKDFHLIDKAISDQIKKENTWFEICHVCNGSGTMPSSSITNILQCTNCLGEGEIEYEYK